VIYLAMFVATFALVFLKAFQQLNVVHHKTLLVVPTSFGMAACEVASVGMIAITQDWWLVVPMGLGGGTGCLLSMAAHRKVRQ
jgi:hypothetical protein